jgi:hypothetical protein
VVKSELDTEKFTKALHFKVFVLHTKVKLQIYIFNTRFRFIILSREQG